MKYIQKNADNVIIAMTAAKPETMEDLNGVWQEVEDADVITAANGKMYYKQVDEAELREFSRNRRLAEIPREIEQLETSQARPLRELELIALGVMSAAEKDVALAKLQRIQAAIESLRLELAELA